MSSLRPGKFQLQPQQKRELKRDVPGSLSMPQPFHGVQQNYGDASMSFPYPANFQCQPQQKREFKRDVPGSLSMSSRSMKSNRTTVMHP